MKFSNKNLINSFMTEVLTYRNQSIGLQGKTMDWFLNDRHLCHERVDVPSDDGILNIGQPGIS